MTTEESLLAAIWAEPHDDTPRLVYADWLDEHDQPDRAAFIRLQIELAKLDEWDEDRRPALVKREQAVWKKHAKEWKADLPKLVQNAGFARGFPDPRPRGMGATKFLKLPASEFAAAPLWTFNMPHSPASLVKLLACPHLLHVGGLGLSGWLYPAAAKQFVKSPNVRNVAAMDLQWTSSFGSDGLAALADESDALPHLKSLNLDVCWVTDKGVLRLADSPLGGRLRRLDLGGNNLKAASAEAIFAPGRFASLTDITLHSALGVAARTETLKVVAASSPSFRLRRLSILIEEKANLKAFAAWPGLASVRELDVRNSLIRDRVGVLFASPHLRELRALEIQLTGDRPTDYKAFDAVADGSLLPNLRELKVNFGRLEIAPVADKLWARLGKGFVVT